jgi:hypothetical protein
MRPDELERRLRERLDALGPAPRAELLHVLTLPDIDRADAIGAYWGTPKPRLRRATDRLRGGPDAPGGAGRHAAGGGPARLRNIVRRQSNIADRSCAGCVRNDAGTG